MKFQYIIIFTTLLLTSCGNKERFEFYGNTLEVDIPEHIEVLKGNQLELDGLYSGLMYAYDGIIFFRFFDYPEEGIYLYDTETGKLINTICKRGNGPNEVISVDFDHCVERDSNGIAFWFHDFNRDNLMLVNLQGKYLKKINTTKFDPDKMCFSRVFILNDSLLISYKQFYEVFENSFIAPSNRIYNYRSGKMLKEFKFYSDYRINEGEPYWSLHSSNRIKPDKSKIAMPMQYLNYINIFDIESGKIKSIKPKGAHGLDFILSGKQVGRYYGDICCDDHYIYVLMEAFGKLTGMIHVFDWEGNFTHILQINKDFQYFAFDPVRKVLYAKNEYDEITYYDVKFLYK